MKRRACACIFMTRRKEVRTLASQPYPTGTAPPKSLACWGAGCLEPRLPCPSGRARLSEGRLRRRREFAKQVLR